MSKRNFYIAGICASADGMLSMKKFFKNIGTDTNISFVVIPHLSKDYKSQITSTVSRCTPMPVEELNHAMVALPDHVYVLPAQFKVLINNGVLLPLRRKPDEKIHHIIDDFYKALAKDQKENAIAIVFSGTSVNGTSGSAEIRKNKGLLLVENPLIAGFSAMPATTIKQSQPQMIADPAELATSLRAWTRIHRFRLDPPSPEHQQSNSNYSLDYDKPASPTTK